MTDIKKEEPDESKEDGLFAFGISEDLVPSREQKLAGLLELDFGGLLSPPLRLHEDVKEGNGGQAWPAGMVLAEYLLKYQRAEMLDKCIIEIGAGGGLVSLAVAQGMPRRSSRTMFVTDLPQMVSLITDNIGLLVSQPEYQTRNTPLAALAYSWGEQPVEDMIYDIPPDVVLAADCVYFEPAFPLLLKALELLVGPNTVCWFCFKRRRRADMIFARKLKQKFKVLEIGDSAHDPPELRSESEAWQRESIHLYRVTAKGT